MELLEQCKEWNDNEEYKKVVDALEILPENARTPEMDSEVITGITSEWHIHTFTLMSMDLLCITLSRHWMPDPEMKTQLI